MVNWRAAIAVSRHNVAWTSEGRAAMTTFFTMAYVLFANPSILQAAMTDVPQAQLLTVTALCAAFGSILMGLLAGLPFALAPGMGLNAYFAFTLVGAQGVPWPAALTAVFVSGVVFLVLSVSGVRRLIVEAIPASLKAAMGAGIGMFLAFIGLSQAGLVVNSDATLVTIGQVTSAESMVCLISFGIAMLAMVKGLSWGLLLAIAGATTAAIFLQLPVFMGESFGGFSNGFVALPVWPDQLLFQLDWSVMFQATLIVPILTLLFVDFFDTAGTLYGLASKAGFLVQGQLPAANRAFLADACSTMFSGLCGSSPTTTYVESASGIEAGGRTGWTAIMVGLLFLLAMFFWPLITAVPAAATAGVLIAVGAMMMTTVKQVLWQDSEEAIPAFLVIALIPLTYSIAEGIAAGIIAAAVIRLSRLALDRSSLILYGLAGLLAAHYIWLK